MTALDYAVLVGYFLLMTLIGILSMLKVKKQEDYFMGSRGFGRILQAFAAFGAGTGSWDPVTVGRTTFTSGLSGIWSVLLWLFVTPFYWICGVWYRRMRHLTLGDWFVERYQSRAMGGAYALFGIVYYMMALALGFSAIGKVGAPLANVKELTLPLWGTVPIESFLVIVTALVVLVYGVLGGLRAAYWTDLIQGIFVILLSVLLIPAGLNALVDDARAAKVAGAEAMGTLDGFKLMHEQVPEEYFEIVETPRGGEFPLHYIAAITLLNLIGIVVQPHFIATGGGSAKTETSARVGLVSGNFMKRFCTIGWALTALIVLAYMADNVEITEDPDRVWGVAARELLGPFNLGLVGLMLACLMAALMSSASCYMLVVSALVVRNGYAAYVNPNASERVYVLAGRLVGALVIVGGAGISLYCLNVFQQLKTIWEMPILFAAPFWIGMFWRRAASWAAWLTILFSLLAFFVVPAVLPVAIDSLAENQDYVATNDIVTTTVTRKVAPSDAARREGEIALWHRRVRDWARTRGGPVDEQTVIERFGPSPERLRLGTLIQDTFTTGGKPIYWKDGVEPIDEHGNLLRFDEEGNVTAVVQNGKEVPVEADRKQNIYKEIARIQEDEHTLVVRRRYDCRLRGRGSFNLDFLLYARAGVALTNMDNADLETLRLPTRLALPFAVMILLSLITPRSDKQALDRFYVKMKTPVDPDPETDKFELEASYQNPSRFDHRRLLPFFGLEFQRPKLLDIVGFVISFLICFAIIWFTFWLVKLGS